MSTVEVGNYMLWAALVLFCIPIVAWYGAVWYWIFKEDDGVWPWLITHVVYAFVLVVVGSSLAS